MDATVYTLDTTSNPLLKIFSTDNNKGGVTHNLVFRATNTEGVSSDYTFTVAIDKNCQYVDL